MKMKVKMKEKCLHIDFQSAGTSLGECNSTMLLGTVQVLGSVATTVFIEKFGRKVLLIISDFFICISMIGVAVFFLLDEKCKECQDNSHNSTTTLTTLTTEAMATT